MDYSRQVTVLDDVLHIIPDKENGEYFIFDVGISTIR
jgi:hypothetical protein